MEELYYIMNRFKPQGLLIDTNLFLLLLVGRYDIKCIDKHKRLSDYTIEDFNLLFNLINRLGLKLITTPHILTEITNLSDGFNDRTGKNFYNAFPILLRGIEEVTQESLNIIENNMLCFMRLGLTDSAIFESSQNNYLVLTVDFDLYSYISSNSFPVFNFNHLRKHLLS